MSRINHRQIEAFRAVMLTGSMTGAADMMHITQPAVSRLIRDLEALAGFSLFERNGPRIQATLEATELSGEVDRQFSGLQRIERTLEDIRTMQSGAIRIAAMNAPAMAFLPRLVAGFMKRHPSTNVWMHTENSRTILEQVSLQHYEFGFGAFRSGYPGVVVEELPDLAAVLALPADHRMAEQETIRLEQLTSQRFIELGRHGLLRHQVDHALAKCNARPVMVMETSLSASICTMVAESSVMGIIDPFTAYEVTDPRIAIRKISPPIRYDIAFAHSSARPLGRIARELIDDIRDAVNHLATHHPLASTRP